MVWFQCEDCGDNLKKPKLPNHFRTCSAQKLSCIDCGQIFGQDTVQDHTQCITEAEKYGPKGQGKSTNVSAAKPNKESKQRPEVDINVGLSDRPPWFCSLCNTKATSKQTLLLHADGKKHRAKARAFHAANQPPNPTEKSNLDGKHLVDNASNDEGREGKDVEQPKSQDPSEHDDLKPRDGISQSEKKRKPDSLEVKPTGKRSKDGITGDMGNGEVIQGKRAEKEIRLKKDKIIECGRTNGTENKIKWKKFIKSALKSHSDGSLKMKKLRKLVFKALQESGIVVDETELSEALQLKINSSSRFVVEGKCVRLVAKD